MMRKNRFRQIAAGLVSATGFLTIIPLSMKYQEDGEITEYTAGGAFFPLVGLLIGGLTYCSALLFQWLLTQQLSAVLVVAVWAGLTGGLHIDGLADCFDGLFVSASQERRLEIMHDSRLGTFGAAGLVFYLSLKMMTVASIPAGNMAAALLFAPLLARLMLLTVRFYPLHWPDGGMGSRFAASIGWRDVLWGAILPVCLFFVFGWKTVIALFFAWLVQVFVLLLAHRRLGLVNGDVLGMVVEMSELAVLLVFSSRWMLL